MYNIFQQNLEKVPKIWEGTPYLFTFSHRNSVLLPYKLYVGKLPASNAILQLPRL